MGTKIKVWLDSGANHQSCREVEFDLEEMFGMTLEQLQSLHEDKVDEMMREIAFERADWGWTIQD